MAVQVNLSCDQGATYRAVINVQNPDGSVFDLTGCTAEMELRPSYPAPDPPTLMLTSSNGGLTLGGTAGTIAILITAAQTSALVAPPSNAVPPTGTYYYDLFVTETNGNEDTLKIMFGTFTVNASITRA